MIDTRLRGSGFESRQWAWSHFQSMLWFIFFFIIFSPFSSMRAQCRVCVGLSLLAMYFYELSKYPKFWSGGRLSDLVLLRDLRAGLCAAGVRFLHRFVYSRRIARPIGRMPQRISLNGWSSLSDLFLPSREFSLERCIVTLPTVHPWIFSMFTLTIAKNKFLYQY